MRVVHKMCVLFYCVINQTEIAKVFEILRHAVEVNRKTQTDVAMSELYMKKLGRHSKSVTK